jgi:hypothetical protein
LPPSMATVGVLALARVVRVPWCVCVVVCVCRVCRVTYKNG